ncbi:MAG: hypothetical protein CL792_02635 [Chloroflexi bacterium]|nr:hypothetical protein [Chloroflexota bacterium]|tara:strand:+ start:15444 stop:15737 length:294 start_codon:yes stop_codon:yes gene_type:complete
MTLKLYDPKIDDLTKVSLVNLAPRLTKLSNTKIALLSNGKFNADVLLRLTAEIFEKNHQSKVILDLNKHSASRPCPQDIIDTIVRANVDFMITAVGD